MFKKKLLYILILFPSLIFSQIVGFKYQAVVRGPNGDLLVNQQVSFKTTILSGSAIGTEVFSETHTVGTNGYGVVNLNIGNGTAVSGSYSNIDWSSATHFLKTELDITGGSSYQFMGTSQILSVPYAEYAEMSGSSVVDNDTSATNEIQQLSLVGNQLVLSNGGSVTLTGTVDLDADPSNELQSLSLSNDTLYLSQGNNVVLPPDSDGDATNEIQVLSLSNDTLYLTSGGYVVLPPDSDEDATNELQVLSLSNDTLYLTSGGYVVLPPDSDGDANNEIQALSLSNDTLYLTDGGFAVLPQELDSDTTNEIQTLSYSNDTLSISNGNQIVFDNNNISPHIFYYGPSTNQNFIVPNGITILEITLVGGMGGNGGDNTVCTSSNSSGFFTSPGGEGGLGGMVNFIISCNPGDTLNLIVGSQGINGANALTTCVSGSVGNSGISTSVSLNGVSLAEALGGSGGGGAGCLCGYFGTSPGTTGANGSFNILSSQVIQMQSGTNEGAKAIIKF